jgi:hypothetical protein
MRVSIYWLTQATEKHRSTIKKRVAGLDADKHGRYDSAAALEAIYYGAAPGGNGEFVSTPEAVRRLTIAKEEQIRVQTEIVRGERIPREDVESVCALVFQAIRGVIKASKLPISSCNEIFDSLQAATQELRHIADEVGTGNGQYPA